MIDLGGLKAAVADMKRQLGKKREISFKTGAQSSGLIFQHGFASEYLALQSKT